MKFIKPLSKKDKAFLATCEMHDGMIPLAAGEKNTGEDAKYIISVKEGDKKRWVEYPDLDRPYRAWMSDSLEEANAFFDELAPKYTGQGEAVRITRLTAYPEFLAAADRLGVKLSSFCDAEYSHGYAIIRQS